MKPWMESFAALSLPGLQRLILRRNEIGDDGAGGLAGDPSRKLKNGVMQCSESLYANLLLLKLLLKLLLAIITTYFFDMATILLLHIFLTWQLAIDALLTSFLELFRTNITNIQKLF